MKFREESLELPALPLFLLFPFFFHRILFFLLFHAERGRCGQGLVNGKGGSVALPAAAGRSRGFYSAWQAMRESKPLFV